jgi:Stress responsive A/B Barrel Domain
MVTHIVVFFWIAGVTSEQVESFRQALDQLALEVKELAAIRHGPDLHFRDGNGDYVLVATLPNRASWDTYQSHPAHKAFVRDFVTPLQARRVAIQF